MSTRLPETCAKSYTLDESKAIHEMVGSLTREGVRALEDADYRVMDEFDREKECWTLEGERGCDYFTLEVHAHGKVVADGRVPKVAHLLALAMAPLVGPYLIAVNEW